MKKEKNAVAATATATAAATAASAMVVGVAFGWGWEGGETRTAAPSVFRSFVRWRSSAFGRRPSIVPSGVDGATARLHILSSHSLSLPLRLSVRPHSQLARRESNGNNLHNGRAAPARLFGGHARCDGCERDAALKKRDVFLQSISGGGFEKSFDRQTVEDGGSETAQRLSMRRGLKKRLRAERSSRSRRGDGDHRA